MTEPKGDLSNVASRGERVHRAAMTKDMRRYSLLQERRLLLRGDSDVLTKTMSKTVSRHRLPIPVKEQLGCFVCGRPAECKDFLWARACGQALSCVRPHSAAVHPPRARMGSTQIGSKSAWRARGAPKHSGFSDPVLLTVCPYPLIDLLTLATPSIAISASFAYRFRSSITLSRHHQGPGDPRRAVRQRHGDNKARLSLHHLFEP